MDRLKLVVSALGLVLIVALIYLFTAFGQYQTLNNEYAGYLDIGFERNGFILCDGGNRWAISGSKRNDIHDMYAALKNDEPITVYAVVNGTVSEEGGYGHMRSYERELQVSNIVSMSTSRPAQCQSL